MWGPFIVQNDSYFPVTVSTIVPDNEVEEDQAAKTKGYIKNL